MENLDSGKKSVVKLREKTCTCRGFYEYQSPCAHAITACRWDGEDPFDYFDNIYLLKVYRSIYEKPITPISIENLPSMPGYLPPLLVRKRGRPKTKRHRKGEQQRQARKCGRCREIGHNTRICLGLRDRAGRGERARQWRQEQEN